ncbi:MAG: antibiotic biosynthesis monooxygenase [Alphaproteobacteria bacterium]|nr:antibiotic biosynthesis monooxygenase [Alphaproteobacteria bacterium]
MTEQVHWLLEVDIKPGQLEAFRALMREMVAATQANEPDTLNYEWLIDADQKTCHIYERYRDSAATLIHLGTFGATFAKRFMAVTDHKRIVVYGNPNADVTRALDRIGAVYLTPFGGFAR